MTARVRDLFQRHALRISCGAIAILGLALWAQSCRLRSAEAAGREARAAAQELELTAKGWEAAARASRKELEETVPGLRAELEAAKHAGAPPLLATRTTASAHWDVDRETLCRENSPGADAVSPRSSPPASTDTAAPGGPSSSGLDVDLELETAVNADELGRIYTVTKAWGAGRLWGFELPRREFAVAKETTTKVDPELQDALNAWRAPKPPRFAFAPRPFRQWRAGWSCGAGAGVAHDGRAAAIVGCLYGAQF